METNEDYKKAATKIVDGDIVYYVIIAVCIIAILVLITTILIV